MSDAEYDRLYDELVALEEAAPGAGHARLADPARRRAGLGPVPEGAAPRADGLAREGHDRRGARQVGRGRPQAPRHRRARRLRDRAEDRRARGQPDLRERRVRARRDARRRHPGRGRDAEPADDQGDPAAHGGRRSARGRRGARRGLPAALRLPRAERAPRGDEPEARAQPAQRGRRLAPAEELRDHRRPASVHVDLRHRPRRGRRVRRPVRDAASGSASAASARTRTPSGWRRSRRSPPPAASGRGGGSSSTTRSTGS